MRTAAGYAGLAIIGGIVATIAILSLTPHQPINAMEMFLGDKVGKQFASYLAEHGKSYASKEEYEMRRQIFEKSLSAIMLQDDSITWDRGLNMFSDMNPEEFKGYLGEIYQPNEGILHEAQTLTQRLPLESYNWTSSLGPVRKQGFKCASCWAFTAVTVLEGCYAVKHNVAPIKLSVQMLIDCVDGSTCAGGYTIMALKYVQSNGIVLTDKYNKYSETKEICSRGKISQADLFPINIAKVVDNIDPIVARKQLQYGPIPAKVQSNTV